MIVVAIGSMVIGIVFALVAVGLFAPDPQEIHDRLCRDRIVGPMRSDAQFWYDVGRTDDDGVEVEADGMPVSVRVIHKRSTDGDNSFADWIMEADE